MNALEKESLLEQWFQVCQSDRTMEELVRQPVETELSLLKVQDYQLYTQYLRLSTQLNALDRRLAEPTEWALLEREVKLLQEKMSRYFTRMIEVNMNLQQLKKKLY